MKALTICEDLWNEEDEAMYKVRPGAELKKMGVQTLWLMPIQPISNFGRKGTLGSYYAVADYTAINPEFGTMNDFNNLIN